MSPAAPEALNRFWFDHSSRCMGGLHSRRRPLIRSLPSHQTQKQQLSCKTNTFRCDFYLDGKGPKASGSKSTETNGIEFCWHSVVQPSKTKDRGHVVTAKATTKWTVYDMPMPSMRCFGPGQWRRDFSFAYLALKQSRSFEHIVSQRYITWFVHDLWNTWSNNNSAKFKNLQNHKTKFIIQAASRWSHWCSSCWSNVWHNSTSISKFHRCWKDILLSYSHNLTIWRLKWNNIHWVFLPATFLGCDVSI